MLYLSRRAGEAVIMDNSIEVRVVELKGKTVKLGFTFPPTASVLREEIFEQVKRENEEAARAAETWDGETRRKAGVLPDEGG